MRSPAALSLAVASLVALSACGGDDGSESAEETGLSQAQTAELLLTQEEFPLEGFTRGEVVEREADTAEDTAGTDEAEQTAAADDTLAALIEGQDVPEECRTALEAASFSNDNLAAESLVTFSGEDSSSLLPQEVQLVVATVEGDSPLEPLAEVSDACEDLELEESGVTLTLSFSDLEELEGTRMTIAAADQEFEMTIGGRTDGTTMVAVLATGVPEADVVTVVDAQEEKIASTE